MADSNSLKVMSIFEAGARLNCSSEVLCLAAHIYHRFFRITLDSSQYELFTFSAACIKLAYWFYELPLDVNDLCLVMVSIVRGQEYFLEPMAKKRLEQSIDLVSKVISTNLSYQINYKDTRMMTPGDLSRSKRASEIMMANEKARLNASQSDDDNDLEVDIEDKIDRTLARNCKYAISSHRYLAHYLKSIKLFVDPISSEHFKKVANIAWTILNDFYWSPCVTQVYPKHLACACLMMAIEACRKELNSSRADKAILWKLLNRKWNLIFCDELNKELLDRLILMILEQYKEYERTLQHELNTYVIDPTRF